MISGKSLPSTMPAGAGTPIGHHQRGLVKRHGVAVEIAQVFRCRFLGLDTASRVVVAAVNSAGEKGDAGAEMGDHEVKLREFVEHAGISEPGRRQDDIELKTENNRQPPLLHDLRPQRRGRVNEDRHAKLLGARIDR